jgi:hypothetical protein
MQFLQRATTYVLVFDIKIPPFVYFLNIIRVIVSTNKVVKYILSAFIYFWYQTDSGVPNTSVYSAVSLSSPYYNYL